MGLYFEGGAFVNSVYRVLVTSPSPLRSSFICYSLLFGVLTHIVVIFSQISIQESRSKSPMFITRNE